MQEEVSYNTLAKTIAVLFLLGCVFFFVYHVKSKSNYENEVKSDYEKTIGWIVKYSDTSGSDAGSGRFITYQYSVNNRNYVRSLFTKIKFAECNGQITGDCSDKRFWVVFSVKDTSKSLINFDIEIQKTPDLAFPESIDDFK